MMKSPQNNFGLSRFRTFETGAATRWCICTILIFYYSLATGQEAGSSSSWNYNNILERLARINPTSAPIQGTHRPKPVVIGSSFLNEHFDYTTFLMSDGQKYKPHFAKYDLLMDEFLVHKGGVYYSISGKSVLSFFWVDSIRLSDHQFVRLDFFKVARPIKARFIEILSPGKLMLAKATEAAAADPNYNIVLDAGRRDIKIFTKELYLFVRNDSALALPPPRQIPFLFEDQQAVMEQFIEVNRFDLKQERDLMATFDFFNERVERLNKIK